MSLTREEKLLYVLKHFISLIAQQFSIMVSIAVTAACYSSSLPRLYSLSFSVLNSISWQKTDCYSAEDYFHKC